MTDTSRISVILVSYRTGPIILDTIAALGEDPQVDEVILVDNGNSAADRAEIYTALAHTGKGRLLQGQGNIGFARGCNYGTALATGSYLHFLNPDAVPEPGASRRLAGAGASFRSPWLAGGLLVDELGREQPGARRGRLTALQALIEFTPLRLVRGLPRFARHDAPLPDGTVPMPTVSGASLLMPRADFEAVGGFDEGYFLHVEDIALCRAVRAAGGTVVFVPGARARHVLSSSDAPAATVEGHKLQGFRRYFGTATPGIGSKLVSAMLIPLIAAGLGLRLVLRAIRAR